MQFDADYAFVLVGAGSSGCVLANRLTADPGTRVLLLEAGGRDTNMWIHIPAGFYRTIRDDSIVWDSTVKPGGDMDPHVGVPAAGLEQQDARTGIGREPVG